MGCCAVDTLGGVPVGSPQTWESVLATGQFTGADAATPGGNDPTISDGDSLFWSDGTQNRLEIIRVVDDIELRMRDGANVLQGTIDLDTATAEVRFPANVTLDSASPTLTAGDGTATPRIVLNKGAGNDTLIDLLAAGTLRWRLTMVGDEDFIFARHDAAGVFVDNALEIEVGTGDVLAANRLGVSGADPDNADVNLDDVVAGTTAALDVGMTLLGATTAGYFVGDAGDNNVGGFLYTHLTNFWGVFVSGASHFRFTSTAFTPETDLTEEIGEEGRRFQFAYLGVVSFEVIEIDNGDSPFTVDNDGIIRLDLTGGSITLTLPAVETGRQYVLEVTAQAGGAGNDIVLDPAVGDSVDAGAVNVNRTISTPTAGDGFFLFAGTTASNNWRTHGPIAEATV